MPPATRRANTAPMTKRVIATFLWFYTGWYLGAEIAYFTGLNAIVGPAVGIGAALFLIYGPTQGLWRSRGVSRPQTSTTVQAPTH